MVVEEKLIEALIIQYDETIRFQRKLLDCGFAEALLSIIPINMENRKVLENLINKSAHECERVKKSFERARDKVSKLFAKHERNIHLKEFLDFAFFLSNSRDCDEYIDAESNSGAKISLREYRKSLKNNNTGNEHESGVERQCDEIATNSSSKLSIENEKETDESDENSGECIQKPTSTPAKLFNREQTKKNQSFYCTKCGKSYPMKNSKKELVNCPICNMHDSENGTEEKNKSPIVELDEKSNGKSHKIDDFSDKSPSEISKLSCKICGRKFSRSNTLGDCAECGKHFPRKQNLKSHISIHNPKPQKIGDFCKPIACCNICGQTYSNKNSLRLHIRRMHSGEKPFECTECYKRFFLSSHLKRHASVHGSHRPFKCSVCNVGFKTQTGKKRHERTVHGRDAPLQCAHCDKRFSKKQNLSSHIHTKHQVIFSAMIFEHK